MPPFTLRVSLKPGAPHSLRFENDAAPPHSVRNGDSLPTISVGVYDIGQNKTGHKWQRQWRSTTSGVGNGGGKRASDISGRGKVGGGRSGSIQSPPLVVRCSFVTVGAVGGGDRATDIAVLAASRMLLFRAPVGDEGVATFSSGTLEIPRVDVALGGCVYLVFELEQSARRRQRQGDDSADDTAMPQYSNPTALVAAIDVEPSAEPARLRLRYCAPDDPAAAIVRLITPRRRIAVAAEPGNAESRAEGQSDSDDINDVWGWDGDVEAAGASDTSHSSGDDGLQTALRISTGAAIDTEVGSVLRGFAIDVLDESGEIWTPPDRVDSASDNGVVGDDESDESDENDDGVAAPSKARKASASDYVVRVSWAGVKKGASLNLRGGLDASNIKLPAARAPTVPTRSELSVWLERSGRRCVAPPISAAVADVGQQGVMTAQPSNKGSDEPVEVRFTLVTFASRPAKFRILPVDQAIESPPKTVPPAPAAGGQPKRGESKKRQRRRPGGEDGPAQSGDSDLYVRCFDTLSISCAVEDALGNALCSRRGDHVRWRKELEAICPFLSVAPVTAPGDKAKHGTRPNKLKSEKRRRRELVECGEADAGNSVRHADEPPPPAHSELYTHYGSVEQFVRAGKSRRGALVDSGAPGNAGCEADQMIADDSSDDDDDGADDSVHNVAEVRCVNPSDLEVNRHEGGCTFEFCGVALAGAAGARCRVTIDDRGRPSRQRRITDSTDDSQSPASADSRAADDDGDADNDTSSFVVTPGVVLLELVPGCASTLRANGAAYLHIDGARNLTPLQFGGRVGGNFRDDRIVIPASVLSVTIHDDFGNTLHDLDTIRGDCGVVPVGNGADGDDDPGQLAVVVQARSQGVRLRLLSLPDVDDEETMRARRQLSKVVERSDGSVVAHVTKNRRRGRGGAGAVATFNALALDIDWRAFESAASTELNLEATLVLLGARGGAGVGRGAACELALAAAVIKLRAPRRGRHAVAVNWRLDAAQLHDDGSDEENANDAKRSRPDRDPPPPPALALSRAAGEPLGVLKVGFTADAE